MEKTSRNSKMGQKIKQYVKQYSDYRVLIKGPKEVKAEALMRKWRRCTKGYKYIQLETILNFSRATATFMFPCMYMNLF